MAKTKPLDPKPTIEDPHVIRAILAHLGLPAEIPHPDPPQPPPVHATGHAAGVFV